MKKRINILLFAISILLVISIDIASILPVIQGDAVYPAVNITLAAVFSIMFPSLAFAVFFKV